MAVSTGGAGTDLQLGVYWPQDSWDLARSAYVADLDTNPDAPGAFVKWLAQAIERHAARTPAERAVLEEQIPERSGIRGSSRGHRVGSDTIATIDRAVIADRRELARIVSRSAFVLEAVNAAASESRKRLGRPLPPPPRRLASRPPRRLPSS
ncbi:MAG: hypothetical protein HZY75_05315 [Nocardioidaceae bacterium]|nr:MAG: hypothetical protein HZY75_05315 [Nocardioidaceae bacterium]